MITFSTKDLRLANLSIEQYELMLNYFDSIGVKMEAYNDFYYDGKGNEKQKAYLTSVDKPTIVSIIEYHHVKVTDTIQLYLYGQCIASYPSDRFIFQILNEDELPKH